LLNSHKIDNSYQKASWFREAFLDMIILQKSISNLKKTNTFNINRINAIKKANLAALFSPTFKVT